MRKILVWRGLGKRHVLGEVRTKIDVANLCLEDVRGDLGDLTFEEVDAAKTPEEEVEVINRHFGGYSLETEEDE